MNQPSLERHLRTRMVRQLKYRDVIGDAADYTQRPTELYQKKYKYSILIPSRDRLDLLFECIDSLCETAFDPDSIEFIVVFDRDDYASFEFEKRNTNSNIISMRVDRSVFFQRDYTNVAAKIANGDLLWILNDECYMSVPDWDIKIYHHYINHREKDDVCLLAVQDDTHYENNVDGQHRSVRNDGPCFPILTRTFVETFGVFFPPEINMWGADWALYSIFRELNRCIFIDDVEIQHRSRHSGTRDEDAIYDHVSEISVKTKLSDDEHKTYVNVIRDYTNEISNSL